MSGFLLRAARGIAAGVLLAAASAAHAASYEPPAGTVEYAIHHSKYEGIGTHSLTFSRDGADTIVDVDVEIRVKLLFVTVHSLFAQRRETWRDGRMVAYASRTNENGKLVQVSGRTEGGKFVIEGPDGRAEADGAVFPTNPWHPDIARAGLLMDTKTGRLLKVSVAAAGEEEVTVAGKAVKARKHAVSGDMERELWFDPAGNLLQFRFVRDGATLTFTRTTPLP